MPFPTLFWGRVPARIDHSKKGTLILTSLLEDLVAGVRTQYVASLGSLAGATARFAFAVFGYGSKLNHRGGGGGGGGRCSPCLHYSG